MAVRLQNFPPGSEAYKERIGEILTQVQNIHDELGSSYIFSKEDKLFVRDEYLGWLLKGHRHRPEREQAILALAGKFDYVHETQKAAHTTHYQTFIHDMGSRLSALGGSLYFADPETGKYTKSAFANFLETDTKQNVRLISSPDIKHAPAPKLFETADDTVNHLVNDCLHNIPKEKQILITCWHEGEAQAIYDKLCQETTDSSKVGLITGETTSEEESDIYRKLAYGGLKFVVSAGRTGIGVDIKKNDGSFPDLHVVLYNMPLTRQQVSQAIGRRRADGDSSSWYVSHEALERFFSYFKKEPWLSKKLGKKDIDAIENLYEQAKDDPAQAKRLVYLLLHEAEIYLKTQDDILVGFDHLMEKTQSIAFDEVRRRLEEQLPNTFKDLSPSVFKWIAESYGIPASLWTDVFHQLGFFTSFNEPIRTLIETRLPQHLFDKKPDGQTKHSWIDQYLNHWIASVRGSVSEYHSAVFAGGKLKQGNIFQVAAFPISHPFERTRTIFVDDDHKISLGKISSNGNKLLAVQGTDDLVRVLVNNENHPLVYKEDQEMEIAERNIAGKINYTILFLD